MQRTHILRTAAALAGLAAAIPVSAVSLSSTAPPQPLPANEMSLAPTTIESWTAEMIAGHERSVALYTAQAQGGQDKDLRQYARDTLPAIEHHLAELRKLQK